MSNSNSYRDRDFIQKCQKKFRKVKDRGEKADIRKIAIEVLSSPAPCYYVDYYRANSILLPALRNARTLTAGKYKCSSLYVDMLRDLRELASRNPYENPHELILRLCTGKAGSPKFYMSLDRALRILKPHIKTETSL